MQWDLKSCEQRNDKMKWKLQNTYEKQIDIMKIGLAGWEEGAVRTICRAPNKDLSRVGPWQGKMPIGYAGWYHGWQDIGGLSWFRAWPQIWAQSLHLEAPMPPTSCNTHRRPLFAVHCQCTWRIALSSCRDSHLKHPLPRVSDNQSSKHDVAWWDVCTDPGLQRVSGQ